MADIRKVKPTKDPIKVPEGVYDKEVEEFYDTPEDSRDFNNDGFFPQSYPATGYGSEVEEAIRTNEAVNPPPAASLDRYAATILIGPSANSDSANYDYVTDGTADQVEIQAAIDSLGNTGGKIVLREGTYNISSPISLRDDPTSSDNITFEGMGTSTIIKAASGLNNVILNQSAGSVFGANPIFVRKIKFDGNSANQVGSSTAIAFNNESNYSVVESCWFVDCPGIAVQGFTSGSLTTVAGLFIRDCVFDGWGKNASTVAVSAFSVTGCYFLGSSVTSKVVDGGYFFSHNFCSLPSGYNVDAIDAGIVDHNSIEIANAANTTILSGVEVSHNVINVSGTPTSSCIGIQVQGNPALIIGNSVTNVGIGIEAFSVGEAVIANNTVNTTLRQGIHLLLGSDDEGNVVVGNVVLSPSRETNNTYNGIEISGPNNVINGNVVRGAGTGNQPKYCIAESTSSDDPNIITSNFVTNFATGGINSPGGTSIIEHNLVV